MTEHILNTTGITYVIDHSQRFVCAFHSKTLYQRRVLNETLSRFPTPRVKKTQTIKKIYNFTNLAPIKG